MTALAVSSWLHRGGCEGLNTAHNHNHQTDENVPPDCLMNRPSTDTGPVLRMLENPSNGVERRVGRRHSPCLLH